MAYEIFELGDVVLQSKQTIRGARLAYKTYGTLNAALHHRAEHVRHDDEVPVRIERLARPDQPLVLQMRAGIPAGIDRHPSTGRAFPRSRLTTTWCSSTGW
jgi:hypothetical protein